MWNRIIITNSIKCQKHFREKIMKILSIFTHHLHTFYVCLAALCDSIQTDCLELKCVCIRNIQCIVNEIRYVVVRHVLQNINLFFTNSG